MTLPTVPPAPDDLTEAEKKVRAIMDDPGRWQRWCRAVLRRWTESPAGQEAVRRYREGEWRR